jgi:hypothetical protein
MRRSDSIIGECAVKTLPRHSIDGAFVESRARQVKQSINPATQRVLGAGSEKRPEKGSDSTR